MDPIQKRELKRQAWMRLAAQKRRAGLLRGRVVVISLICFAVLWGVVFAQMATGNDPVLTGKEKTATTRTVASAKREVETTDPRELEAGRQTDSAPIEEEAEVTEEEPEVEEEAVEVEPEFEEEFVEEEPLVTSQS
jgi:non-ribosomal peptide synthetase component E (peptide arylation enzyme)